jgi:glucokinase
MTIISIDLGGTNLRSAVITGDGRVRNFTKFYLEKRDKTESGIIEKISEILRPCILKYRKGLKGAGIALPGFIDFKREVVTSSPNYPLWRDFPIKEILHKRFKIPVVFENDANAFAIGEGWKGAGKGLKSFAGITLGTGVGGGIILDKKIWHGSKGSAGEVGHITVEPGGLRCNCGNRGCLEMYASAQAVAREGKGLLIKEGISVSKGDMAREIFKLAHKGNKSAIKIFSTVGYYLGIAIADIANILNIDGVIIGGGMSNAWEFIYPAVKKEVSYRANPLSRKGIKILKSKLGDLSALIGMAKVILESNTF